MKRFSLLTILLVLSCKSNMEKEKLTEKINLKGRTFVLNPEKGKGTLTVQFMDSTCNILDWNQYNRPWRLINFEKANILMLAHMTIPLYEENDSTIIGLSIGERDTKLRLEEKLPKWKLDKILGKWTEERWAGVENSNIPPPPARFPEHDTIWPPYYEISKNKLTSYCLGIDSTTIQLDNSLSYMIMKESLYTEFVGYQKKWKLLKVTDTAITIERRYSKDFISFSHSDSTETFRLIKKR
ncbi:hypothetical protein [Costertonia aggregata]|uniref:Uncharacterized protein n=1 Tax=Costertonia aggregata TaxID=343403 RepID=A0A7H9ATT4_9FLAO|nr:hypothetical protein [Costertonia aggregata]QLG46893.1 hypothetical protein HYG79_16540 [Costertonia aggregata]